VAKAAVSASGLELIAIIGRIRSHDVYIHYTDVSDLMRRQLVSPSDHLFRPSRIVFDISDLIDEPRDHIC